MGENNNKTSNMTEIVGTFILALTYLRIRKIQIHKKSTIWQKMIEIQSALDQAWDFNLEDGV